MKINSIAQFILKNVLPAIVIVLFMFALPLAIACSMSHWHNSADFDEYKEDYIEILNLVRDYTAENYGEVDNKIYMVSNKSIYDYDAKVYLDLTDAAAESLIAIRENAFKDLGYIRVQGNRVLFGAETRGYAVIYSPNSTPKWYVNGIESSIDTKRICKDWYHVRMMASGYDAIPELMLNLFLALCVCWAADKLIIWITTIVSRRAGNHLEPKDDRQ